MALKWDGTPGYQKCYHALGMSGRRVLVAEVVKTGPQPQFLATIYGYGTPQAWNRFETMDEATRWTEATYRLMGEGVP